MPGVYGTIRPATIDPEKDVDIYYYYRPTRGTEDADFKDGFKTLESSCLVPSTSSDGINICGLYSLKLPLDKFNSKGIYTIFIKPHEMEAQIVDVSILDNYSNPVVEGIVINSDDVSGNTNLDGYRIEYYDDDGQLVDGMIRLVTSSNSCIPVKVTVADSYARATRYKLTNASSEKLVFCTLTPSTSSSYKPNVSPSIGYVGQTIHIINTKFNPVMLEIEMVDHDADTISTMLEGDQIRDLDHGLITTYDTNKEIYKQHEIYTLKSTTGKPLYDVKHQKGPSEIDVEGQEYDKIVES